MPDPTALAALERAIDAFDDLIQERGWGQPPLLLGVEHAVDPDAGAELGVRELDGHPAQTLLGFSAPLAWTAIGVSAEGWATSPTDSDHGSGAGVAAPDAEATQERVRTLVVLDRDGQAAGRLRWKDGRVGTEAPDGGLIVDCLRRAMGRRTAAPTTSTATLFTVIWLGNVVSAARRRRRQVSWPAVVALHPAVQVLARSRQQVKPGELVEAANALAKLCDWTMVRHQMISGWRPCDIDSRVAVWMDTGMLSRWLLESEPTVEELLATLDQACPPAVVQRVRHCLDRMDPQPRDGKATSAPASTPEVA